MSAIDQPRNLESRSFVFRDAFTPEPLHWTHEEIHSALSLAPERMKLFILLALNLGAGQKDIADLRKTEVDWQKGIITRFRSKARGYANRRRVSYPLWPETLRLLRRHRSGQDRVLLSEDNTPLWSDHRTNRKDLIRNQFKALQRRLRKEHASFAGKSFYDLRKTGAFNIERQYGRNVADLYLAHGVRGVTEESYTGDALHPRLTEAVRWLGSTLGLGE